MRWGLQAQRVVVVRFGIPSDPYIVFPSCLLYLSYRLLGNVGVSGWPALLWFYGSLCEHSTTWDFPQRYLLFILPRFSCHWIPTSTSYPPIYQSNTIFLDFRTGTYYFSSQPTINIFLVLRVDTLDGICLHLPTTLVVTCFFFFHFCAV